MTAFRTTLVGVARSTALVAGSLLVAPAAEAAETPAPDISLVGRTDSDVLQQFSSAQLSSAVDEATAGGYVTKQTTGADGSVTSTLDLGQGFVIDVVQSAPASRLSAGTDGKGTYVAFNSTDQNVIISGAGFGIAAGLCALSAGTFCVVAGAIITAATIAIAANGGVRCSGGKALRVYPFAGGKVKPRCV